ncbi:MAG: nitrite/sulfite reductase [Sulfurimonas sp.]|jgi:ferredoxin-nitrite reductase|nr:nitrite/sulfite reductase [Sulfurimonadaceae bacterium]
MENKLNKRERYKAQLRPIDYYKDFENLDFTNLGEGDRFYLQDFGIFTTDFLEDEFTIRIRIPGGQIKTEHFLAVAEVVEKYDLTIIITARGGLQLHDITADNILEIHKAVNATGLSTWQSFGDNVRNIVCDIFDDIGEYAVLETYSLVMQMQEFILQNPKYVGLLPRRLGVAISGNSVNVTSLYANDIYFALAKKDDIYGFNVYMGGKNIEVPTEADIFLKREDVVDFFIAFAEAFHEHGSRFSRSRTRVFHLIEDIGIDGLKNLIKNEYKKEWQSRGELVLQRAKFEQFHKLKDGTYAYCYETAFSKLGADEMRGIAKVVKEQNLSIRIGMDQKIYLIGLKEMIAPLGGVATSQTVVACAGNLCPYAVWSIKEDTKYIPLDRIKQHTIQVGFSGCAKGCGRHRHTDIGLIGLKTNNFGDVDGGARIFLGAIHTTGESTSRMLFSMVPFPHLKTTLDMVINHFEASGYSYFEEYALNVLNNYSEEFIALWTLACLETNRAVAFKELKEKLSFEDELELLRGEFASLDFWEHIGEDMYGAISYLGKKLWTIEGADPTYKPPVDRVVFR